jgi:hypothetical protein
VKRAAQDHENGERGFFRRKANDTERKRFARKISYSARRTKKDWRLENLLVKGLFMIAIELACIVTAVATCICAVRLGKIAKHYAEREQRELDAKQVRQLERL